MVYEASEIVNIVIIDDDISWNNIISSFLKSISPKIKISTYQSAERFLEDFKHKSAHHPDLIVCDNILDENMTGLELKNYLNQLKLNIPFLLITGYTGDYTLRMALQSISLQCVSKTQGMAAIKDALKKSCMQIMESKLEAA